MRKHDASCHIADRINTWHIRLPEWVRFDSFPVIDHSGILELQTVNRRLPADCHKDLVRFDLNLSFC